MKIKSISVTKYSFVNALLFLVIFMFPTRNFAQIEILTPPLEDLLASIEHVLGKPYGGMKHEIFMGKLMELPDSKRGGDELYNFEVFYSPYENYFGLEFYSASGNKFYPKGEIVSVLVTSVYALPTLSKKYGVDGLSYKEFKKQFKNVSNDTVQFYKAYAKNKYNEKITKVRFTDKKRNLYITYAVGELYGKYREKTWRFELIDPDAQLTTPVPNYLDIDGVNGKKNKIREIENQIKSLVSDISKDQSAFDTNIISWRNQAEKDYKKLVLDYKKLSEWLQIFYEEIENKEGCSDAVDEAKSVSEISHSISINLSFWINNFKYGATAREVAEGQKKYLDYYVDAFNDKFRPSYINLVKFWDNCR